MRVDLNDLCVILCNMLYSASMCSQGYDKGYLTKVPWASSLEALGPIIYPARQHPKIEVAFVLTPFQLLVLAPFCGQLFLNYLYFHAFFTLYWWFPGGNLLWNIGSQSVPAN